MADRPPLERREGAPAPAARGLAGSFVALGSIALGALYLANIGWGVLEILPDNLPLVGNLDEAGATAMVLFGLRYLGLDLGPRGPREPGA